MSTELKTIVEALLFAAEGPLTPAQLMQVLDTSDKDAVADALARLREEYQATGRAFELVEVAGGHALRTRPDLAFWIRKLKREQVTKLSPAALETLAIIAYKQPVLKAEIERLRGVEVGGVLRMLMEKDLVRVAGRKDLPGRPLIYGTTRRFLEVFDLKDLKDLPTLEEMEALAGEQGELFAGVGAQGEGQAQTGSGQEPGVEAPAEAGEDELAREWEERLLAKSGVEIAGEAAETPAAELAGAYVRQSAPASAGAAGAGDEDEPVDEDGDCDPPPEAA